jgi:two-component system cell cycle response regulator
VRKPRRYTHVRAVGAARQIDRGLGLRLAVGAVLFGGATLVTLHDWLGIGGSGLDSFVNGHLYDSVVVAAGLACLLKARGSGGESAGWLAIAAAILCWAAGEIYWTEAIADNPSAPFPSPADIGYLAFYPLAGLGVYLLVRARARELDWRLWMDGLIAALGTAALGSALVFEFVADHAHGSAFEVATLLAYPIGDVLLLGLVIGVVALTRWRPGRTWTLLLLGLAAMVVADVAYTLQSTDATLPAGDWIEPIYLLAAVCLGAAAWLPPAAAIQPSARFDGFRELAVPSLFAAIMIGLFVMQSIGGVTALTTVLWGATLFAVLARLAISVRENKRLLEQVRTDPLTGLGNQGSMHADLEARFARAEPRPFMLVLFDLNGFKRFNDTFGHPAGDEMLRQFGGRLREAVSGDGAGYRVGGDEFAVLLDCEKGDREAAVKRSAEALSAHGKGFEVGSSWGAVAIPAEADSAAAALRLADVRMYAQKESRRLAHDDAIAIDGAEVSVEAAEDADSLRQRRGGEALEHGE